MTLSFAHVGPPVLAAAPLPPLPHQIGDYALAYDAAARRVVYAISPGPHQFGPAWSFDGAAWQPLTSTTVRVGSATQRWRGVFDPVRRAVVGWGFDYTAGPVGVVLSPAGGVLGAEGLARYDDGAAPALPCGGAFPEAGTSWNDLAGVFGADPVRGVTVCLTERGLWELDDRTWTKKADADGVVPSDVDGDPSFGTSGGAGACFDARRGRVVFWFQTDDDVRFVTFDGRRLSALAADGLPRLWRPFGDGGFAIGEHPEHGIVVDDGAGGLFGLGDSGFVRVSTTGEGPRGKAVQLAYDVERATLWAGPALLGDAPQRVFRRLTNDAWTTVGAPTKKSVLSGLSSGFIGYCAGDGEAHAVSLYLRTARFRDDTGWEEIVDVKAGDAARNDQRAQAVVRAFGQKPHAIMADGSVLVLEGATWRTVAGPSTVAKDLFFPLAAFDETKNVIVVWGSNKKSKGRKNDTFVFDGTTWRKPKKKSAAPADDGDAFDLCFDKARGQVVRVGVTELACFDGETWTSSTLSLALGDWRRAVWPQAGKLWVADLAKKRVHAIDGAQVTLAGTFEAPAARKPHENLPFDRWWSDERGLVVHGDDDDRESFRLLLPAR